MDCGRTLDAVRKRLPWGVVGHRGCPFRRLSRGPSAFVPRTAKGNPVLVAAVVSGRLRALRRTRWCMPGLPPTGWRPHAAQRRQA
jgi:hypothetical protein